MKKSTLKNLSAIICLIGGVLSTSNAQIIYTDVNPDATSSGTYNLDLNNDGTIDFVIAHTTKFVKSSGSTCKGQSGTNHYIRVTPLNNNQVLDDKGANARMMAPNERIDASASTWNKNSNQLMISYEWGCRYLCFFGSCGYIWSTFSSGLWQAGDGYLGLKLKSGGHVYYGWVRINILPGGNTLTIRDYAFNSTANQGILASQPSAEYLGVLSIPVANNYICAGNNITVPYLISGTFSPNNIVTAELSDASGSFTTPVEIGSITSHVSGNINAVISSSTPSGYGYRIRVRSSDPVRISYPNEADLGIDSGLPYADISPENNITNLCTVGDGVRLYASTATCNSYQWKLNGINIPRATSSTYIPAEIGDYTCRVTNGVGSAISNSITVNSEPPSITISVDPTSCNGSVNLFANSNDGGAGSFQWKQNGVDIPGAISSYYSTSLAGNYSCAKSNNCGSITSNTIIVTPDLSLANATITANGPTAICSGQVVLNANTATGLSYQWYHYYDSIRIPGATNSSYTVSVSGIYYVVETNSLGCTRYSGAIDIFIGTPSVSIYSPLSTICHNNPVYLSAVYYPNTNLSFQWIKDGTDISGATGSDYYAGSPGTYAVRATIISGGCSSTSAGVVITEGCTTSSPANNNVNPEKDQSVVARKSNPAEEKFVSLSIAPNPISSSTTISFTLKQSGKVSLRIYDMNGRLISTIVDREFTAGKQRIEWTAAMVNSGIYILRLQTPSSDLTRKLVIIK